MEKYIFNHHKNQEWNQFWTNYSSFCHKNLTSVLQH